MHSSKGLIIAGLLAALLIGGGIFGKNAITKGLCPTTTGQASGEGKISPKEGGKQSGQSKTHGGGDQVRNVTTPRGTNQSTPGSQKLQEVTGSGKESISGAAGNTGRSSENGRNDLSGGVYSGGSGSSRGDGNRDTYKAVFLITAYTAGKESTGKRLGDPGYGITTSGARVKEGVTVSADWEVLPQGTVLEIEGVGRRVVQDTGGAIRGNRIDLYFDDIKQALEWGRQHREVKVIKWGGT